MVLAEILHCATIDMVITLVAKIWFFPSVCFFIIIIIFIFLVDG